MHFQEFGETGYRVWGFFGLASTAYDRMHLFGWRTDSSERQPSLAALHTQEAYNGTNLNNERAVEDSEYFHDQCDVLCYYNSMPSDHEDSHLLLSEIISDS